MSDDKHVSLVLEKACGSHLMDDNDNTILEIHCSFSNKKSERVKKIRSRASAAADNVMKTFKCWIEKASLKVNRGIEDFVIVEDDNKQNPDSPAEWANRFITVLFHPEKMQKSPEKDHPKKRVRINLKDTLDALALDVVEGVSHVFDMIDEVVTRHEVARASRRVKEWGVTKQMDENEKFDGMDKEPDLEKTVEIEFDVDCKQEVSEEVEEFAENVVDNGEEDSLDDAVVLEVPIADDVISVSSGDDTLGIANCDVSGSDDDSWAMMDDDF